MNTDTVVLNYPFGTAKVVTVLGGSVDRPVMVMRHMYEAAEVVAAVSEGRRVSLVDQQTSTVLVHEPFSCKLDFAGIQVEIVVMFSSTRYIERRQLGRYVYPLFPAMLRSLGLDIDNIRAEPTPEMTDEQKRAAFLNQVHEPLAVNPYS